MRRPLLRQHLGECHLRGAADRGRRAVGAGRLGADVEDADDPAPFALLHLRHQDAAEADLREQFQIEIGLPLLVGDGLRRPARRLAGVVDEDIDLAEFRIDLLAGRLDRRRLRDVAADRGDLALRDLLDLALGVGECRRVARQNGHIRSRGGEFLGDREAEPLAAAGDDRASTVQSNFHDLLRRSVTKSYRLSRTSGNPGLSLGPRSLDPRLRGGDEIRDLVTLP